MPPAAAGFGAKVSDAQSCICAIIIFYYVLGVVLCPIAVIVFVDVETGIEQQEVLAFFRERILNRTSQ